MIESYNEKTDIEKQQEKIYIKKKRETIIMNLLLIIIIFILAISLGYFAKFAKSYII